jgi:hypothetical protein
MSNKSGTIEELQEATQLMSSTVRFWGRIIGIRPRVTLTKFAGETTARSAGHLLLIEGTRSTGEDKPVSGRYTVAIGPAILSQKGIAVGDLLRGDAHTIPEETPDVRADLYRVGVLRVIARVGQPGAGTIPMSDPPRTDPPLSAKDSETAPRRPLKPENLQENGTCHRCPYGTIIPVVRLTDPRNVKNGQWTYVPACLGPSSCPHYESS